MPFTITFKRAGSNDIEEISYDDPWVFDHDIAEMKLGIPSEYDWVEGSEVFENDYEVDDNLDESEELTYDQAVEYLKKNDITCDPTVGVIGEYVCDLLDDYANDDIDPTYSKSTLDEIINRVIEYKNDFDDEDAELTEDRKSDAKCEYKKASDKVRAAMKKYDSINESDTDKSYSEKAWMLNRIIEAINDEEAYYGSWLYVWPDGETKEDCENDFGDEESYKDLESLFIRKYKTYHDSGLFTNEDDVIEAAHEWDKKLGLEEIEVFRP